MVKIQKNPMRLSSGPVIYANFDFQLPVTREYPHLAQSDGPNFGNGSIADC